WPADTFVDFNHGLNSAISRLREALADSADSPRFVETVARRGYRFIAPVETVTRAASGVFAKQRVPEPQDQSMAPVPEPFGRLGASRALTVGWSRRWMLVIVAILAVAIVGLALRSTVGGWNLRRARRVTSGRIQSVVVLPFDNLTGDPA